VTTYVHPTFLYESLWNFAGFFILHFLSKKRRYDGEVLLMYLAWYGLGRAIIEGLRTDSLYIPGTGIRVSQLLAAVTCVIAVALLIINRTVKKHDPKDMLCNKAPEKPGNAE
ncbi:MAG: prolipoprotein diacylglyceryl transferase, partial [Oscillospiraceae bacterium]|nr:prolipoprotein diacylglyceryl transferase [Oscillospiraceae bacterium]